MRVKEKITIACIAEAENLSRELYSLQEIELKYPIVVGEALEASINIKFRELIKRLIRVQQIMAVVAKASLPEIDLKIQDINFIEQKQATELLMRAVSRQMENKSQN